jgi:PAS domain S-box-containing protein
MLSRTNLVTLLIAATITSAIWAIALLRIHGEQELAFADEVNKNTNLAQAHEERSVRVLQLLDQTLLTLRNDYARNAVPPDLNERLAALHVDRANVGIVSLIDARGDVIATTADGMAINFADREYFRAHAADDQDRMLIGKPIQGRFTGKWLIALTRRVNRPDGSFGGVVFMAVDPATFARDYRNALLGPHAALALIGLDGITRVRRNSGTISYGEDIRASRLFREIAKVPAGHYVGVAASDGVLRTASYRVLDGYPLVVVVASSLDDINASLRGRKWIYLASALVVSVLIMALALMLGVARVRRSQALATLKASEARYRALVDWSPEPVLVNRNETIVYVNAAATRLFGASFERELVGKPLLDMVHPDSRDSALVRSALPDQENATMPMITQKYLRSDGAVIDVEVQGTSMTFDGELAWLLAIRDVTERMKAETALRELSLELEQRVAARTAEIEAFMYSVSHDLRAPLRAIDGYSAILQDEPALVDAGDANRLLGRIRNSVKRMSELLNDLLDLSRYSTQELQQDSIDMYAKVESIVAELECAERNVRIEIGDLPACTGDRILIRQVWINLIGNALKYSAKQPQPVIRIGYENGAYFVRDNGAGFDQANVDKLFGLFNRLHHERDYEGTGIGLAFVKRIVERHHGRIWAAGEIDKGATFWFTIPA